MRFAYAGGSKPLDGYTIKRGIGVGGFGEVYHALSDAGKEVALKRIQRNLDVELRGVSQCINLKHINLISLWDIRENEAGERWVVMEYVPGPSLRDVVIANPNGLPGDDTKEWFCSTAAGVAYLHEQDIVHRDLKPGNIFYDEDQQVIKIGDYGLSKLLKHSRRSGQTESVGTFHYMAPEIGKGEYGRGVDIYALGIILYEMLTGCVPFLGESSQEIIMRHLMDAPDLGKIPTEFHTCVSRALSKDPERRYRNIPEMCSDLPWEDVASNSKEIVKRMTVGPVVLNGYSDRPNLARTSTTQPTTYRDSKIPSMLIDERPDIIFGELKDSTKQTAAPNANNGSSTHEVQFADEPNPASIPEPTSAQTIPATAQAASIVPPARSAAPAVDEPVARAVKGGLAEFVRWWNHANFSTPVKVIVLIGVTAAIVKNSGWLLPGTLGLGFIYLVYYVCYSMMYSNQENESESLVWTRWQAKKRQDKTVRQWLGQRETSDRTLELVSSLIIGSVACVVFNLLAIAITGSVLEATLETWASFAWLTVTSISATCFILLCGKWWEHRRGDPLLRRLGMAVVGIVVGLIAYSSAGTLNVDLNQLTAEHYNPLRASSFVVDGLPLLPAYLILFCVLFGVIRWWIQSDPLRRTRLSTWAVGICLVWTAVLSHILDFVPVWNCILVVVISIAVQLASPWMHPEDRSQVVRETKSSTNPSA